MNLRNLKLVGMIFAEAWALNFCALAQTQTPQLYTLIKGSQLTDDCPVCDRLPIVVPMVGTFGLRVLDDNPLKTRCELSDISFRAGPVSEPNYQVTGSGTYEVGGEVAVVQDMFLDLQITNAASTTMAECINSDRSLNKEWPTLGITVDQTNGTPAKVYHLVIIAIPIPKVQALVPDPRKSDLLLEWEGYGGEFQLERATNAIGPYLSLSPNSTKSPFTDIGVLTNHAGLFYRLRQL